MPNAVHFCHKHQNKAGKMAEAHFLLVVFESPFNVNGGPGFKKASNSFALRLG